MAINWSATGEMLSGLGTTGGAIAIIVAALVGQRAVADFRRQKQIEREIEHAERALAVAYQLEMALSAIRSPMTSGGEESESRSELEKTDWFAGTMEEIQKRIVHSNIFFQRIRRFSAQFDEALAVLPFVKAYFGPEAGKALSDLISTRHSVRVYADAYGDNPGTDLEFQKTIQSYIYEGFAHNGVDPIKNVVDESIAILDRVLIPVIRSVRTSDNALANP